MADELGNGIFITVAAGTQSLALDQTWPELGIKNILSEEIEKVSQLGQSALRSKVPIKTGELRNEHIQIANGGTDLSRFVYVSQLIHEASAGKNPPTAITLALLLSGKALKRSRASIAEGGFTSVDGSTQGWIDEALNEFDEKLANE